MRWVVAALAAFSLLAAAGGAIDTPFSGSPDHPAIRYATRPLHNAISGLNRDIESGKVQLRYEGMQGYLRSTLQALEIPIESQMVVFSKTSLQQAIISPRNPRTIFFGDSVAVGWVRGEPFVEVAALDDEAGVVFYTLDQNPAEKPQFRRRDNCLTCHESFSTLGVPGMLLRSVYTTPSGTLRRDLGDYITDHRSPFEERWGGWYVTGKAGPPHHMGNLQVSGQEDIDSAKPVVLDSLAGKFDTSAYLSPHSDIAALLVFAHQMRMTNLITRLGWESRVATADGTFAASRTVHEAVDALTDYMLFVDEAPLPAPLQGNSGFAEVFAQRGPRDRHSRSLRQLDLQRRLMRYPCSYMIYSSAFDALPDDARTAVYERMARILSGKEKDNRYARLSRTDRRAVVEILRDTKSGLPAVLTRLF